MDDNTIGFKGHELRPTDEVVVLCGASPSGADYAVVVGASGYSGQSMAALDPQEAISMAFHILTTLLADGILSPDIARDYATSLIQDANGIEMPFLLEPSAKQQKKPGQKRWQNLSPQAQTIFQHIRRSGSISAHEAMNDHGIAQGALTKRICDIEAEGFTIRRDRRTNPVTQRTYTRYFIEE